MAMPANAARALEQVKMGLYILYGAAYFTEDEWIKIDGLIHKGKYVFTQGPPANFLEDELMSFDNDKLPEAVINRAESFELIDKHNAKVSEEEISSASSKSTGSPSSGETSNAVSSEQSSANEASPPLPQTQEEAPFDLCSDMTKPPVEELVERPAKSTPVSRPSNGGLALGYTQAHIDEIKAFNAGLTKAGEKSGPKYVKESYTESVGSQDGQYPPENDVWPANNEPEEEGYPSPAQTEGDNRIQTWASGVETHEAEPTTTKTQNKSVRTSTPPQDPVVALVTKFQKTHGRLPKVANDIFQPNNAEFRPLTKRPESRASITTSKTAKSIRKPVAPSAVPPPALNVPSGTVLVAQHDDQNPAQLRIDVLAGDHIRVIKHVSGILHYGINLRTNITGQFPNTIFKKPTKAQAGNQQNVADTTTRRLREASVSTSLSRDLDSVERINAAEWDEVPVTSKRTPATPAPIRPSKGGLANSRFAALGEIDSKEEEREFVHGVTREQVDRIFDDKLEQILKAQKDDAGSKAKSSVPTKTATCWFWETPNKSCRFTAEECRDLHEYLPGRSQNQDPANLRSGKPTWGAAADSIPLAPSGPSADRSKYTCHFWANGGQCSYSADKCKYMHAWGSAGVASKPGRPFGSKVIDWSRNSRVNGADTNEVGGWGSAGGWDAADTSGGWDPNPNGSEVTEGEFVLQEVGSPSGNPQDTGSLWTGLDSGTDKYKPPHIKALEEKALENNTSMW